ncbi:MAG: phosphate ABC transporter permease subunit PstC [Oscillatoriales cyanobacterium RM1_1_9]|nr:phosphate ABC transporter permease subunit PstC [Oscillatoriales cyanobacterium SM2_3_0]NJO47747.1 phosphate ABC transporter permease subunit PstC [Oscillatoriales cyanobacterium RM2_1_1]NJO71212.1 phosphate ABC transporter permease subunit PstC [Oscillatoriales cyanobacterium RM1_1_9]
MTDSPGFSQSQPSIVKQDLFETQGAVQQLDKGFTGLVWLLALASGLALFWISFIVLRDAQPAIQAYGLPFIWGTDWDVSADIYGALPFIYGTLVTSFLALLFAVPLGVAVAIITSEDFLPEAVRSPIAFLVEIIASIPSVIVGLWGIFVFVPFILPIQKWLYAYFSWLPMFSTDPFGFGLLTAGLVLTIMILPTVAAISRDVMQSVPKDLRSASMSLGATRWETIWRILLPAAGSGILGASILALGRALGETMAVTMVIGNSIQITPSLLDAGYSIPAVLANQFPEAYTELHVGALMYLSLLLFVITLIVNAIAVLLVYVVGKRA